TKLFYKLYKYKFKRTEPENMPMKQKNSKMKYLNNREKLDDIGIRILLIPFFGIAIPVITRMVPYNEFSNWQIKFSYLYTIFIALVIYEGSRFLLFTLRSYFDWINKPLKKGAALILTIPFYCIPVSVLMLVGWYHIFLNGKVDWQVVKQSAFIITGAVFFLVNVYETVFAVRDIAADKINKEQLERARAEAELEALKNQVDPHFIFNSLNTLSFLIENKPVKAKQFNDSLADVYRYILQNKARDLVLLKEEINFLRDYFSLVKIRFEDAVLMKLAIAEELYEQYLIPPISLQILVENAIKHNEFSDITPLQIDIMIKDEMLEVCNIIKRKVLRKPSSKIGLRNLQERYKLITDQEFTIAEQDNKFVVHLPLLKI
ncbi:MAG: histidine kinase, partial [Ferruginibacter sp.]